MSAQGTPLLRYDVTTNDWVLFAPTRATRPHPRPTEPRSAPPGPCPFCPGNERLTAPEIDRIPDPAGRGWSVRVLANKYPALARTVRPDQRELGPMFREMGGYGVHEVVVESPEHSRSFAAQPLDQAERVIRMLHARFVALMGDPALRAIVVFKNHGERAGTSQPHPHWQIIATPVVPRELRLKHEIAAHYFDQTSRCLYCVTLEEELRAGTRVLATNEHYVAVLPFASHVPYQLRIQPREHRSSSGSSRRSTCGRSPSSCKTCSRVSTPRSEIPTSTSPSGRRRSETRGSATSRGTSTSCRASPRLPGSSSGAGCRSTPCFPRTPPKRSGASPHAAGLRSALLHEPSRIGGAGLRRDAVILVRDRRELHLDGPQSVGSRAQCTTARSPTRTP